LDQKHTPERNRLLAGAPSEQLKIEGLKLQGMLPAFAWPQRLPVT
jgi:hypothetical protein